MAIYSGRILARRGANSEFDPDKMLAGEWAVTTDENTRYVYMCFAPGVVKRMATYEDFLDQIDEDTATIQTLLDTLHLNIDSLETILVDRLAINDSAVSTTQGWSSNKISEEIGGVVDDTSSGDDKALSASKVLALMQSLKAEIKAEVEAEHNEKHYPIGSYVWGDSFDTMAKVIAAFGGTTWERIEGKMLMGADSNHAVGTTSGSDSVTLTTANLPSHNHTYSKSTSVANHVLTIDEIPSHRHYNTSTPEANLVMVSNSSDIYSHNGVGATTSHGLPWSKGVYPEGGGQGHSHGLNSTTVNTSSVGSGSSFSVLNPNKATYIWHRTA